MSVRGKVVVVTGAARGVGRYVAGSFARAGCRLAIPEIDTERMAATAAEFRSIDLASALASISAATEAKVDHFVYVSVAHPAPAMKAYWQARVEAEEALSASGMNATVLRPWYVLGPGHRWAYALIPFYALFRWIPSTRESALRLGLVTLPQMLGSLVSAVESPAIGTRIVEVPEIRRAQVS